jgi:YVTN family beta-propeller protein
LPRDEVAGQGGVALGADGRWLYTADGIANQVSIIDTRTLRVVGAIRVGTRPWGIAVSR